MDVGLVDLLMVGFNQELIAGMAPTKRAYIQTLLSMRAIEKGLLLSPTFRISPFELSGRSQLE